MTEATPPNPPRGHRAFVDALELTPAGADASTRTFKANVPDGWQQGRGAFGGLVVGLLARAMEATEGDVSRPLRALTAEIPSPVVHGPAEVRVVTLRRGRGLSSHEAFVVQEGKTVARASGVFGSARESTRDMDFAPSLTPAKPFDEVMPVPESALAATFSKHLEYRLTGPVPFSGGDDPRVEGWVRFRGETSSIGVAEIIAFADSYWPAFFSVSTKPRPAATVTFGLHVSEHAYDLDPNEPLYYRAVAEASSGGYCFENRAIYDAKGRFVARNPQTFAIIK